VAVPTGQLIHADVSEHQGKPYDDSYLRSSSGPRRQFAMWRAASEWDRQDTLAPANLAWSLKARAARQIVNFGTYLIPGFVSNAALLDRLDALNFPADAVVMIDWETWGQLSGNHSANNNDLAAKLRTRQSGRPELVWGYSNRGDLGGWPTRPPWLGMVIAGYSSDNPVDEGRNCIGWQYTNGSENHTSMPSSSAPFGACDHNTMFVPYPLPLEDDVPLTDAEYDQIEARAVAAVRKVLRISDDMNIIQFGQSNNDQAFQILDKEIDLTLAAARSAVDVGNKNLAAVAALPQSLAPVLAALSDLKDAVAALPGGPADLAPVLDAVAAVEGKVDKVLIDVNSLTLTSASPP
jgi:hypothetical protein